MKIFIVTCALIIGSVNTVSAEEVPTTTLLQGGEQANLIIYRPADGFALNYRVIVDGKHVGKLKLDEAFGLTLTTGEHIVSVNDSDHTSVVITVAEGATTYVRKVVDRKAAVQLVPNELIGKNIHDLSSYKGVALAH